MPRKVLTGAAMPILAGYLDGNNEWVPAQTDANGTLSLGILPIPTLTECGTVVTTADNPVLLAPGGGNRIVVTAFCIQNESGTATTMILRAAATTNGWRCLGQNQGDGLSIVFAVGREWRLPENTALNLNLSGNNSCGYSVSWFLEAV